MNRLKESFKSYDFNKDGNLHAILNHLENQGLSHLGKSTKRELTMKQKGMIFAMAFALVLAILWVFPTILSPTQPIVVASMYVEINPGFELSINEDGKVLSLTPLNDDALTFNGESVVGLGFSEAIDLIVQWALANEFIDISDLEDDYVVVTTVINENFDEDMMNRLALQMQAKIQQSENLQSLNVVMIKATIAEAMLAAGLDVPIGLSILKGMVKLEDETMVSAKEFFQKQGNPEAIANQSRVEINGVSEEKIRERIEIALNKLDNAGVDTVELRTRLENAGANQLNQIQSEVRIKANAPVDSNKPDDAGNDQDQGSDNSNKPDNPGNSGNSNKGNP